MVTHSDILTYMTQDLKVCHVQHKNEAPPGLMRDRSCAASVVFSSLRGPLCAGEA